MKEVLLFILVTLIISSSSSGCECVGVACFKEAEISVIDKSTGQDLIFGADPKYFIDSIFTKTSSDTLAYKQLLTATTYNNVHHLYLPFSDTIFLKLNQSDIDTLYLTYQHTSSSKCCPDGFQTASSLKHNGTIAAFDGTTFMLEK